MKTTYGIGVHFQSSLVKTVMTSLSALTGLFVFVPEGKEIPFDEKQQQHANARTKTSRNYKFCE